MKLHLVGSFTRQPAPKAIAISMMALGLCILEPKMVHEVASLGEFPDAPGMIDAPASEMEVATQKPPSSLRVDDLPAALLELAGPNETIKEENANPSATGHMQSSSTTDRIVQYLWSVYQRSPTKRDGHGDFTWKDRLAADRLEMTMQDYVIGGMEADFREQL